MENITRQTKEKNKRSKSSREIDMCCTTRIGVGQQGHNNMAQNTNRQNRLEWRC